MMLFALILIPLLAAVAILLGAPSRNTALGAAVLNIFLTAVAVSNPSAWDTGFQVLEQPNINLSLGLYDGMSVVMLILSVLVTFAAVFTGKCPEGRDKLWFSSILLIAAGAIGAFISTDIFFFYAFHEMALIPTFLMIGILGSGERKQAAWKITIYLAFGSIVLLAGLLLAVGQLDGFAFSDLQEIPAEHQNAVALLLIIGFGTLVSLFPLHSWAAPAYASAPAPVSMLHAGVLKKFGLYGLLRVGMVVAPDGMAHWLPWVCVLLLGNIIWVGLVTVNQKRLDLMLGNSSVMHMGYIFLAIAALSANGSNEIAQPAAVLLMFAHGISIALLFSLASVIERKTGTLEIAELGGLAKTAPALAFVFGLAGMASIGLPGLANFAGEVMVFFAGFADWKPAEGLGWVQWTTIIALWGVVLSAVYMLRAYRNIFQGPLVRDTKPATDLHICEKIPAYLLATTLLVVGIYPQILLQFL
ncbi:NADH-quinone oxidoreductase subunit M [Verrucomicrobiaceae bacterium 5K15]|uniref:NADH-quinone oxidoreductase subunit M n=2 Tax=Oceaniferula flava TaxID=2800421 RepID=A0AAE2SDX3_9BACT|nr:NADH-quinone oxidoreductase subunit M [Oceaniferula flavus]MBM1135847.1 NADH-quinone oxidoreductase subunit M [Oceaniferula flavus]